LLAPVTKAKLGADHPGTLASMHNLATAYQTAGQLELALALYEQTVKLRKARLGAVQWLVALYEATGNQDEAARWRAELDRARTP
jgi:hypothetical protein